MDLFAATILAARKLIDMDPNKPNTAKGHNTSKRRSRRSLIVSEGSKSLRLQNGPALGIAGVSDLPSMKLRFGSTVINAATQHNLCFGSNFFFVRVLRRGPMSFILLVK
jgi:hypothetical protein